MTAPPGSREHLGLAALAACVDTTPQWDQLNPAAQGALTRACRAATPTSDPLIPATVHRSTRSALIRAGLAYPDGPVTRVTHRGQRVTAWALWAASGDSLDTALDRATQ